MAYYLAGDYYLGGRRAMGDYYRGKGRGDPFWGALWSGIRAVGGALLGARPAAQAGAAAAAQGVSGVAGAAVARTAAGAIPAAARATLPGAAISAGTAIARRAGSAVRTIGPQVAAGIAAGSIVEIGGRLFDANTGRPLGRRRMNPANPRALRRSIRRVVGFARLASRSKRSVAKAATALQCFPRRSARAARRR